MMDSEGFSNLLDRKIELDQLRQRVTDLEAALFAIAHSDWVNEEMGYCEICHGDVEDSRLEHAPNCPIVLARKALGE